MADHRECCDLCGAEPSDGFCFDCGVDVCESIGCTESHEVIHAMVVTDRCAYADDRYHPDPT